MTWNPVRGFTTGGAAREATVTLMLVGGPFNVPPTPVDFCAEHANEWRTRHPERIHHGE